MAEPSKDTTIVNERETSAILNSLLIRLNAMKDSARESVFGTTDNNYRLINERYPDSDIYFDRVQLLDHKTGERKEVGKIFSSSDTKGLPVFNVDGTDFLVVQYDVEKVIRSLFMTIDELERTGSVCVTGLRYFNKYVFGGVPLELGTGNIYYSQGEFPLIHQEVKNAWKKPNGIINLQDLINK